MVEGSGNGSDLVFYADDWNTDSRDGKVQEMDSKWCHCRLFECRSQPAMVHIWFGGGEYEGLDLMYCYREHMLTDKGGD